MKKKFISVLLLMFSVLTVCAKEVPTLLVLTTNSGEVQIPIASIRKITYDPSTQSTMYVLTKTDTQSFELSNVIKMTLSNVPTPSAIGEVDQTEVAASQKILINGSVYVVKDGKIYTLKGEQLQ